IFSASYSSFLLAPLPAWMVARLRGKRTLINYHSGECRDHLEKSALARHVLKKTDRLVVPSGYLADVVRHFGLGAASVANLVDIFVNDSNLDNMPVSVLEAFASGTPVVTTAPEGIRYIVAHERTGLLSEIGDASTLAQNVFRVLNDSELASRLTQNAYEESSRYSWKAVRQQWLEIYLALMQRRSKREGALAGIA